MLIGGMREALLVENEEGFPARTAKTPKIRKGDMTRKIPKLRGKLQEIGDDLQWKITTVGLCANRRVMLRL